MVIKENNITIQRLEDESPRFREKVLPTGKVLFDFFTAISEMYPDKKIDIVEKKDRFSISVDDLTVAALLKRVDSISMYLSKFKPYATTFTDTMKGNVVSYGPAGFFFVVSGGEIHKAVKAFTRHYDDLLRIRSAKEKGV